MFSFSYLFALFLYLVTILRRISTPPLMVPTIPTKAISFNVIKDTLLTLHWTQCSKKRFKRPINHPLKCFRPETEQNLKKMVGLLGKAI